MKYQSFDLLKKLYFVRVSGKKEEKDAAKILMDEIKSLGGDPFLEEFEVDDYEIKECGIKFFEPEIEVKCVGVGMCGSTPKEGIEGEFVYITSQEDAELTDVKDKIVLLAQKIMRPKIYKTLLEKGVKGFIMCDGDVYKNENEEDVSPYKYRVNCYKEGKVPAVCIHMSNAEKICEIMPRRVWIKNVEEEKTAISQNVVCEIKGSEYPDEIICFTAHYDSVPYSRGIWDNATGSTTIMQMLAYYLENKPKRTLRFIWCGSEESGLLGSRDYTAKHKEELEKNCVLCINVDMTGVTLGHDYSCVTGPQSLVDNIKYYAKEIGFAMTSKQGVYSSDSTPFADIGIPAISFARLAPDGGAIIHCKDDVIERLSQANYYATCKFIENISSKWINSVKFPIPKEIPDNMKEELDYYNFRKERK